MPLHKYTSLPTARMEMFYAATRYPDLAVLEFSTPGHALLNYGHLLRLDSGIVIASDSQELQNAREMQNSGRPNAFIANPSETEIILGDDDTLRCAMEILAKSGFKHIFLLPSALHSVIGSYPVERIAEFSKKLGLNVFTAKAGLNDDFYSGSRQLFESFEHHFILENTQKAPTREKQKEHFTIVGGLGYRSSWQEHQYIHKLIKSTFNINCSFDSMNPGSVEDWKNVTCSAFNIVTTHSALPLAKSVQAKYGVPFVPFWGIGKNAELETLHSISEIIKRKHRACEGDAFTIYEQVMRQLCNICKLSGTNVVCYGDIDRICSLNEFLSEFFPKIKFICSHQNHQNVEYFEISQLIERYKNSDCFVLSYDSVCKHMPKAVTIDYSGTEYHLLTPLVKPGIGIVGAYQLAEAMAEALLK